MDSKTVFKITGPNGEATHASGFVWDLPKGEKPGKWVRVKGAIEPCYNGLHACQDPMHLGDWISNENQRVWVAQVDGAIVQAGNKVACRGLRLVRETEWSPTVARLFAADCAERALLRIENPDPRSIAAIEAARKFARGEITRAELTAAWDAAWDAARAAARDAARDAARAAAWDAARAAAWAAARAAAWDAAWDAARAAARDAAWDAAWDAERDWQRQRLTAYLLGYKLAPISLVEEKVHG